jgi:RNA polymerase sigma-70 factor (ECF subfamily)
MQRKGDLNLTNGQRNAEDDQLETLLLATARRSQRDFRMLFAANGPKIHGILLALLRDREQARDALQVTFVRIWNRAATFDPARGTAGAWMVQIARHHAIDLLRQRKRRAEVQPEEFQDIADPGPTAERQLVIRDDVRKLMECLGKLEPRKAEAVRMSYLQGLSYAELAERMDTPLNTVRTWLRRGLAALKECVDG